MRNRSKWLLAAIVLVGLLVLSGIGIALARYVRATGETVSGNQLQESQLTPVFGVTHVFIRDNAYHPPAIEVVLGTVVSWTNQDNVIHSVMLPHTITSENVTHTSVPLSKGQFFNYAFTSRGTFQYYCLEHPNMVGVVIVT
jgi:plastocyanin